MSGPEKLPAYTALSEAQSKHINDTYLRSQAPTDEYLLKFARELTGEETPASLPLFFEYLREGKSKEEVVQYLLQFYCEEVTKEHNAAAAFRYFRAPKRPAPEEGKSKRRKKM